MAVTLCRWRSRHLCMMGKLFLLHLVGFNASWTVTSCTRTLSCSAQNGTETPCSTVPSTLEGVLFEKRVVSSLQLRKGWCPVAFKKNHYCLVFSPGKMTEFCLAGQGGTSISFCPLLSPEEKQDNDMNSAHSQLPSFCVTLTSTQRRLKATVSRKGCRPALRPSRE